MQTEAAPTDDTEALLRDQQSKPKRRWSTFQLILIAFIVMVITAVASNMDRIVDALSDSDSSNDTESCEYNFGNTARCHFSLDPDYTEFNFGAYGMPLVRSISHKKYQTLSIKYSKTKAMLPTM